MEEVDGKSPSFANNKKDIGEIGSSSSPKTPSKATVNPFSAAMSPDSSMKGINSSGNKIVNIMMPQANNISIQDSNTPRLDRGGR